MFTDTSVNGSSATSDRESNKPVQGHIHWRHSIRFQLRFQLFSGVRRCRSTSCAVIELESGEEDEVEILANDLPVARGLVVVQGNRIAVEVRELIKRPNGLDS
jgi:hypothetical protein